MQEQIILNSRRGVFRLKCNNGETVTFAFRMGAFEYLTRTKVFESFESKLQKSTLTTMMKIALAGLIDSEDCCFDENSTRIDFEDLMIEKGITFDHLKTILSWFVDSIGLMTEISGANLDDETKQSLVQMGELVREALRVSRQ